VSNEEIVRPRKQLLEVTQERDGLIRHRRAREHALKMKKGGDHPDGDPRTRVTQKTLCAAAVTGPDPTHDITNLLKPSLSLRSVLSVSLFWHDHSPFIKL
jgi:hypothetical protein